MFSALLQSLSPPQEMLRVLIGSLLASLPLPAAFAQPTNLPSANTYYVSSSVGNDQGDGRSPQSAWRTLARVNAATLQPGDTILFQRDNLWRGQLRPKSGTADRPVTYGAFGAGAKPILQSSVARDTSDDWVKGQNNLWATRPSNSTLLDVDVGNIIFDDGQACGVKKWRREDLRQNGDFWYDQTHQQVWLYADSPPTTQHHGLELALKRHIITEDGCHYVTYDDLHLRYGAAHGIGGGNTGNITVRRCDLCLIGGALQFTQAGGKPVRYGNGIEFWNAARHNLVEQCRLWEIYDAALTDQGIGADSEQVDITYRNNVIWNAEYSFEYWNRPATARSENILFEHNTCVDAGHGWAHQQRPDPNGQHLMSWANLARTQGVVIRDNIFCNSAETCMRMCNDWHAGLDLDHNLWFQQTGPLFDFLGRKFNPDQLAAYRTATGFDRHSVMAKPQFHNADQHDYRLAAGSPGLNWTADRQPCGAIITGDE